MENPDFSGAASNLSCGDTLRVDIEVKDDVIHDIRFDGNGCAISIASASLFTQALKGMQLKKISEMEADFLLDLVKIDKNSVRVKCALLILEAVRNALESSHSVLQ